MWQMELVVNQGTLVLLCLLSQQILSLSYTRRPHSTFHFLIHLLYYKIAHEINLSEHLNIAPTELVFSVVTPLHQSNMLPPVGSLQERRKRKWRTRRAKSKNSSYEASKQQSCKRGVEL
jgi:hypothetical protein